jgi:hypothetical protein
MSSSYATLKDLVKRIQDIYLSDDGKDAEGKDLINIELLQLFLESKSVGKVKDLLQYVNNIDVQDSYHCVYTDYQNKKEYYLIYKSGESFKNFMKALVIVKVIPPHQYPGVAGFKFGAVRKTRKSPRKIKSVRKVRKSPRKIKSVRKSPRKTKKSVRKTLLRK